MRYIYIPLPPNLPTRWPTIYERRIAALAALATHDERSAYLKQNPSWNQLKKWLARFSFNKCWYCEAKSLRAPFDVDHFRPKLGTTVERVELSGHPGYYWLAYEWQNFRLSCQRCNRLEKDENSVLCGKANEFPIASETFRCTKAADAISAESPRLLDPCSETDCALLIHAIDGEVKPAAADGTWEYQRARYTIDLLGFNSAPVPEEKRKRWQTLATLIEVAGDTQNPEIATELSKYLDMEHEYSSFFRSAIGTHRDKGWVEAIL